MLKSSLKLHKDRMSTQLINRCSSIKGMFLKNDTTLEENKVLENNFVVIMLSKKGSSSAASSTAKEPTKQPSVDRVIPAAPATQPPAAPTPVTPVSAPVPTATAVASPAPAAAASAAASTEADPYGQAASSLVAGSNLEGTVQSILEMGGGSWDRDTVVRALRAAFNNPERAVEYLYSGVPEQVEAPAAAQEPHASGQPGDQVQAPESQPAIPSSGPNANPLDLFPQVLLNASANAGGGNLDVLRNNSQFRGLLSLVQANPQILQPLLQEPGKQNPQILQLIQENQAEFLRLINEPAEGAEGNLLDQFAAGVPQTVAVTPEGNEAIQRMDGVDDEARERKELIELTHLTFEVAMMGELGNKYSMTYLNKAPYRISQQSGYEWVMENLDNRKNCYKMFRMYPDVLMSLHDLLVDDYGLQSSRDMTSLESLGMFLWIVGAPQSFSQVENRFARSTETIHRKFEEVLDCLCKLASNNIAPTDYSFSTPHERIKDNRFWPHFEGAIGAIDGSHIPVSVPASEVVNHTGRRGFTSQNVMAVCDFDMRFTFIVVGWLGSAHDTRILNHTLVKYAHKFPSPPQGKYYLVDSGYPNRNGYLAPYKGQTYHLSEFRNGRRPTGKYEVYNHTHSSLRNVIERSFGVLKEKWRILKRVPSFKPRRQKKIIVACMSLHNYMRGTKLRDKEFDKCDADEDYMPRAVRQTVPLQGDSAPSSLDAVNMSTVRDNIANSLISARGG